MPVASSRWRALPPLDDVAVLLSDSVTVFETASAAGAVLITGSHGGVSALAYALGLGARGVIVNDAGIGKDEAGVAGLASVEAIGLAAAAVSHDSARIGDGADTLASGRISRANRWAALAGVSPGMSVAPAVEALARQATPSSFGADAIAEARPPMVVDPGPPLVHAVDSAAQVDRTLEGSIVVTGSHGGATHGRALDAHVAAAFFNDAGIGKDRAGVGRLAILEAQGVPGLTYGHDSARIGDALDAWTWGVVSVVNGPAEEAGVRVGQTVQDACRTLVRVLGRHQGSIAGSHS
jgi:hypothetical protein